MTDYWRRGDTVMFRFSHEERMVRAYQAARKDTVVNMLGWPHIVLEDNAERTVLYIPEGTPLTRCNISDDIARTTRHSHGDSVHIMFPGKCFEVTMFYDTGTGPAPWVDYYFPGVNERFYGWKVDLTLPFGRNAVGFDTIDAVLDICVRPNRTFDWRDEAEMEDCVRLGIYSTAEAEALFQVGYEVEEIIRQHASPFDEEWQAWWPDPDLVIGEPPPGWQYEPVPEPYRAWSGPLT